MKKNDLKLVGIVPIMLHNNQAVDPLNAYYKKIKPLSAKRSKTEADLLLLGRIEWEAGLYLSPEGKICIPGRNIEKCFVMGARKSKNGKKFEEGVYIDDNYCQLQFKGNGNVIVTNKDIPCPDLDALYTIEHIDRRAVAVQRNTIIRTRPIFEQWNLICTILYDENVINEETLLNCITISGLYVGLCEMRPRLGRFEIEKV